MIFLWFSAAFKSREDHRKQLELEEARKAGLAPAELDEDGKEINPHIPQYMSSAPWYLNAERPVRVLHVSKPSLHFFLSLELF
jgi:pre-mRNA-processing factor SLU7